MNSNIPNHSVLRQSLNWINTHFKDLFTDHRSRKFCTGQIVSLLLVASLRQWESLEQIRHELCATPWLKKWLAMNDISTTTLYERLEKIPLVLLKDMHQSLLQEIFRHYRGKKGLPELGLIHAVDSTELILPPLYGAWARGTKKKNFVRMHTCLQIADEDSVCPFKVVLSTGNVHELEVAPLLVTSQEAIHVFDRGYVKYELYREWAENDILFVARIKDHCLCNIVQEHPRNPDSPVILDAEVEIIIKKQPFQLRLVEYTYSDKRGKLRRIRVLTNCRNLTAERVSEVYRARWEVELFFKWMKQHVNLKKWYSHKPDAVWNQIYLSLIAQALIEWIRLSKAPEATCWQVLQTILTHANCSERTLDEVLGMIQIAQKKPPDRGKANREVPHYESQRIIIG